jgi:methanesulfonate monooxygenase large subunit
MAVTTIASLPPEYVVDNRIYTDQAVFDTERERIFRKVWNFVCHESELPGPGSFLTSVVAGFSIIVCRNKDGALRAFYNTCRHRAAQVEREPSGTRRMFSCFYHLWAYDLDGCFINAPEFDAYKTSFCPGGLTKDDVSLVPVRVESSSKLVFVCFDPHSPSLADFLGPVAADLPSPFAAKDLRVTVKWTKRLHANWKMQPENSRDGYHAPLLHKRLRGVSPPKPFRAYANGHAVQELGLDYEAGRAAGNLDGVLVERPELIKEFLSHPLPGVTREVPSKVITLFPDTLVAMRYNTMIIERQVPIAPGETEFETRSVHLASDSESVREIRDQHWMLYWADDGGNLPEDWEAWEAQQRGVQNATAVRFSLIARGEPSDTGLRGDDNRIRGFWAQWRAYMNAEANAPLATAS